MWGWMEKQNKKLKSRKVVFWIGKFIVFVPIVTSVSKKLLQCLKIPLRFLFIAILSTFTTPQITKDNLNLQAMENCNKYLKQNFMENLRSSGGEI